MTDLAARLDAALAEFQTGRTGPAQLIPLYCEAADHALDDVQRAFFLTHAYVHALEAGDSTALDLRNRLVSMGCEAQ